MYLGLVTNLNLVFELEIEFGLGLVLSTLNWSPIETPVWPN